MTERVGMGQDVVKTPSGAFRDGVARIAGNYIFGHNQPNVPAVTRA